MESIFTFILLIALSFADNHYDTCAEAEIVDGVTLTIARDMEGEMALVTIEGPSTAWFGCGLGNNKMNDTYAIISLTGSNGVQERILGNTQLAPSPAVAGMELNTNNERTSVTDGDTTTITIEIPYDMTRNLRSFLECTSVGFMMNIISAKGTTDYGYGAIDPLEFPEYHGSNRMAGMIYNDCCTMSTTDYYNETDFNNATDDSYDDYNDTSTTTIVDSKDDDDSGVARFGFIWAIVCVVFMGFVNN